ncbi:MAG: hypothetical protein HHJ15_18040, partial [Rhodoferax sp.]|uniref:hypothetical protein n=1 Tax=Rhodoferax sp. TaxID=50421 RepID=UPI0017CA5B28
MKLINIVIHHIHYACRSMPHSLVEIFPGVYRLCKEKYMQLSVITQFDGPMFTIGDGQSGQYIQGQQNGTSIATGAVLV